MSKKIFIIFFVAILMAFGLAQTNAIPNWIQTIWKNNVYGIFSPNKPNTESVPTIAIHPDGRLGVGLTKEATITDSGYRAGDVIAKRYCFENDSKECVSTFQQNVSGNSKFNMVVSSQIAKNFNGTAYTDEQKSKREPFYIHLNEDTLNKIGMVDEKTSNWFTIGNSYQWMTSDNLRSFWVQEGDNSTPRITRSYNGHYIENQNEKLVYCDYKNSYGNRVASHEKNICSNPNVEVIITHVCDISTNSCGRIKAEFRLSVSSQNCLSYDYYPTLTVSTWGSVEITNIRAIPYSKNYDTSSYFVAPNDCRSGYINMQMRFRIDNHNSIEGQLLREYVKGNPNFKIKIADFGLITLQ